MQGKISEIPPAPFPIDVESTDVGFSGSIKEEPSP